MGKKREQWYKVGDHVRCTYGGVNWRGVVIGHKENHPRICYVVPMIDSCGHPQIKRRVKCYAQSWLEHTTIPQDKIKKHWL